MGDRDFLLELVHALDAAGIPYMLTGSHGSGFYGEPRSTNDIDFVIDPNRAQLDTFIRSCPEHWTIFPEAVEDAFRRRGMFNVLYSENNEKADLIFRKNRDYSRTEFARKKPYLFENTQVVFLSAEDAILSKLEWSAKGESERQFRDALSVVKAQWEFLDFGYLEEWAAKLGLQEMLSRVLESARPNAR